MIDDTATIKEIREKKVEAEKQINEAIAELTRLGIVVKGFNYVVHGNAGVTAVTLSVDLQL